MNAQHGPFDLVGVSSGQVVATTLPVLTHSNTQLVKESRRMFSPVLLADVCVCVLFMLWHATAFNTG